MQDVFRVGDRIRALVIGMDSNYCRISLSTAELEVQDGDMLVDPVPDAPLGTFLKFGPYWALGRVAYPGRLWSCVFMSSGSVDVPMLGMKLCKDIGPFCVRFASIVLTEPLMYFHWAVPWRFCIVWLCPRHMSDLPGLIFWGIPCPFESWSLIMMDSESLQCWNCVTKHTGATSDCDTFTAFDTGCGSS